MNAIVGVMLMTSHHILLHFKNLEQKHNRSEIILMLFLLEKDSLKIKIKYHISQPSI